MTALPNSPWIESPVEEISLTLLFWTWVRNVGLYGIRTRALGLSAWEEIQRFSPSSTTTSPTIHQREVRRGRWGRFGFCPRPSGAGVTFQPGSGGLGGLARSLGAASR